MKLEINKILIILIIMAISLWFIGINEPFVGAYGANLNYFTLASKNYSRFGYLRLFFLPTYYAGGDTSYIPDFYLHHPVFYFVLVSLPHRLFGFQNWVSAVTPLIFSLFTLFWLYKIGSLLWDKKIGLWASFYGAVFPIMTIFGRQTIFEPAVLSLLLGAYFFFLRYVYYQKKADLLYFSIMSFLAILVDWGGAYFVFPFLTFLIFFSRNKKIIKAVLIYISVIFLGVSLFLLQVYIVKRDFSDLISAVLLRREDLELFALSKPWLRLFLVTLVRVGIYFTPFAYLALFVFIRDFSKKFKNEKYRLAQLTLLLFLIFGLVNPLFLPAATFGHIYFLIYLVPFFCFTLAELTSHLSSQRKIITVVVLSVCFFSFWVTYFKWKQTAKQKWRFEAAVEINRYLEPYEKIAVYNFPGDVFEQYFLHPTKPLFNYLEILEWLDSKERKKIIFSCWDECSSEDIEFISNIPYKIRQFGRAWLIENIEVDKPLKIDTTEEVNLPNNKLDKPVIFRFYQYLRDNLGVGQL